MNQAISGRRPEPADPSAVGSGQQDVQEDAAVANYVAMASKFVRPPACPAMGAGCPMDASQPPRQEP